MPIFTGHGHGCAVTNPSIEPRDRESEDESDGDRREGAPRRGERLAARAAPGRHPRPEDVQAGGSRHEDAGELEQTVRQDEEQEDVTSSERES